MIRIVSVSKIYTSRAGQEIEALTPINLDVGDNEFVAVVGPSGCGKSTLLKMIVGLLPATTGEIYFDNDRVRGPRTDVGMVFQEPILLPWRTVQKNVLFPIEILRRTDRDYNEVAHRFSISLGLRVSSATCPTSCQAACSSAPPSAGR